MPLVIGHRISHGPSARSESHPQQVKAISIRHGPGGAWLLVSSLKVRASQETSSDETRRYETRRDFPFRTVCAVCRTKAIPVCSSPSASEARKMQRSRGGPALCVPDRRTNHKLSQPWKPQRRLGPNYQCMHANYMNRAVSDQDGPGGRGVKAAFDHLGPISVPRARAMWNFAASPVSRPRLWC